MQDAATESWTVTACASGRIHTWTRCSACDACRYSNMLMSESHRECWINVPDLIVQTNASDSPWLIFNPIHQRIDPCLASCDLTLIPMGRIDSCCHDAHVEHERRFPANPRRNFSQRRIRFVDFRVYGPCIRIGQLEWAHTKCMLSFFISIFSRGKHSRSMWMWRPKTVLCLNIRTHQNTHTDIGINVPEIVPQFNVQRLFIVRFEFGNGTSKTRLGLPRRQQLKMPALEEAMTASRASLQQVLPNPSALTDPLMSNLCGHKRENPPKITF